MALQLLCASNWQPLLSVLALTTTAVTDLELERVNIRRLRCINDPNECAAQELDPLESRAWSFLHLRAHFGRIGLRRRRSSVPTLAIGRTSLRAQIRPLRYP